LQRYFLVISSSALPSLSGNWHCFRSATTAETTIREPLKQNNHEKNYWLGVNRISWPFGPGFFSGQQSKERCKESLAWH
jgi:hypothetical protein